MKRFLTQRLLRKKIAKRTARLLSPEKVNSLLYIADENPVHFKEEIQRQFPHAQISFLYPRKEKNSDAPQGHYDYHNADLNLTGKIKSDKLNEVLRTRFDLILDLSDRNPIGDFLFRQLEYGFSIGCSIKDQEEKHDLIIRGSGDELACIHAANTQLTLLNQHEKK
jgi:hypothetical protein